MFGRFREFEDEPDWKEKLAEWRNSPLWVLERPSWLHESPAALLLLFVGIALAAISVVYVVVPADALPSSIPGRWIAPPTTSTSSTSSTTTTTIDAKGLDTDLHAIGVLPADQKKVAWDYIRSMVDLRQQDAEVERILESPPVPPDRRWANALLSAAAAAALIAAAWFVSDERGRARG